MFEVVGERRDLEKSGSTSLYICAFPEFSVGKTREPRGRAGACTARSTGENEIPPASLSPRYLKCMPATRIERKKPSTASCGEEEAVGTTRNRICFKLGPAPPPDFLSSRDPDKIRYFAFHLPGLAYGGGRFSTSALSIGTIPDLVDRAVTLGRFSFIP